MTWTIQMIIFCQARNHPNLSQKITSVLFHGVHSYVVDTLCWRIDNKLLWSSLNALLLSNFTRNDIQSYENEGFHSFARVAPKGNLIGRMTWQFMADMAVPYYGCLHLNSTAQHWQGRYMAVTYNYARHWIAQKAPQITAIHQLFTGALHSVDICNVSAALR